MTNAAFEHAFEQLNPQQKEAVTQIEGPVLVFAGPGTGKTKVLSVRIGHILQQTDVGPGAILCLTFTNAGVQSMKKNLRHLLGPEADKIEVHTYHSFASKLIHWGGAEGFNPGQTVLTDAQRFMILEKLLTDSSVAGAYVSEKPRSRSFLVSMAEIFSDFKKQDIDSDLLSHYIDMEIDAVKNDPDRQKKNGELKKEAINLINDLQEFRDLGRIYDAYTEELERKNKFEYEDLLNKALCRLMENTSFLSSIQETYQYILVDEFQDTNTKQLKLIELLISGVEQPNLFVVGDDDQCIYKFQGASNENLQSLFELVPGIRTISLRTNYRSTSSIIHLSHELIRKNEGRPAEKEQPLDAALNAESLPPAVHAFVTEGEEAFFMASHLKEQIEKGEKPEEIAVLFRKRSYANALISWLNYFEVPFSWNAGKGDVLEEDWGKLMFMALRYFQFDQCGASERDAFLLQLCMLKYGKEAIAILYTRYRFEKDYKDSFKTWLQRTAASEVLLDWMNAAVSIRMEDRVTLEKLADLENWLGIHELRTNLDSVATAWDAFVNEFIETNPFGTWEVFTRLLNYHVHYGLAIEFESETMRKGITLSTIHGSKGLEYNQVYVMGCSNQQWESARNANNKVGIPKPMFQYLNKSADELQDFRRLIYVAFTRAKHQLSFSYVENGNKSISNMLAEVMPVLSQSTTVHPAMDLQKFCGETRELSLSPELKAAWTQSWEKFELTASSLNMYISDPENFIWHSFFKIPGLPSEAMSFGTAVHLALEELIKERSNQPITEEQIAVKWEYSIHKGKHLFDPLHFRQYKNYGLKILFDYFQKNLMNSSSSEYITEAYLHGLFGSVKIAGKIDVIEIRGNVLKVIDYKTGSGYNQLKPFESITSPGDSYWRQGAIYAELIRQNYPGKQLESVQFQFVEKGTIITAQVGEQNTNWKSFCEEMSEHIRNHRVYKYVAPNYFSSK